MINDFIFFFFFFLLYFIVRERGGIERGEGVEKWREIVREVLK